MTRALLLSAKTLLLAVVAGAFVFSPQSADAAKCEKKRQLKASGLCIAQAKAMLPKPDRDFVEGLKGFGCKPVITDAQFMGGDVLLYHAAKCKGAPVKLSASGGAHAGELTVVKGGLHEGPPSKIATIVSSDPADPTANLVRWTRDAMKANSFPPAVIAKCKARRAEKVGPDAWVVDESPTPPPSPDGPRSSCGTYGYTEESTAYWRVFGDFAWFFEMGQDAYMPIDPNSLTLITKNGKGGWKKAAAAAPAARAAAKPTPKPKPASATENYGVANVAGTPGVVEDLYGTTKGYTVYSGKTGGRTRYCVADRDFGGTTLRVGYDGGQWQLAVPVPSKPDFSGGFEVDGKRRGMSGTAAGNWTFGWIGLPELDAIRNGEVMVLDIGRASLDFPLDGTAAAILKVEECVTKLKG